MLSVLVRNFQYFALAVFAIDFLAYVLPSAQSRRAKVFWTLFLAVASLKFLAFRHFGGHLFNPVLPEIVQWVWGAAYSTAAVLAFLSLPALVWRNSRAKAWILPLVSAVLAVWGLWNCISLPKVTTYDLTFPNLPNEMDGYRIAQVSDLHASTAFRTWRTKAVVSQVNELEPDLICLTGDFRDGRFDDIADFVRPLGGLSAPDGVWAVTGNHEYYMTTNEFARWSALYAECGLRFLENRCVFPRPGFALGGVSDRQVRTKRWRRIAPCPDVRQAFAAATNGEFRVLMEHRPVNARENIGGVGVDLQLSGHTHGGIVPIFDRIVARNNRGFVSGLYRLGKGLLIVSTGVGQWAGFPMRLFNDCEITLVILHSS